MFFSLVELVVDANFNGETLMSADPSSIDASVNGVLVDLITIDQAFLTAAGKFLTKHQTPFIVCQKTTVSTVGSELQSLFMGSFHRDSLFETGIPLLKKLHSQLKPEAPILENIDFYKIRIAILLNVGLLSCDIYIRLSEEKFVELLD